MERLAELLFILASIDRLTLLSEIAIEKKTKVESAYCQAVSYISGNFKAFDAST